VGPATEKLHLEVGNDLRNQATGLARQLAPAVLPASATLLDRLTPFQALGCYVVLKMADILIERWFDPVVTASGKRTVKKILGEDEPRADDPDDRPSSSEQLGPGASGGGADVVA
jgi:hypothetical protein